MRKSTTSRTLILCSILLLTRSDGFSPVVKPASRRFSALLASNIASESNGGASSSSGIATLTRETGSNTAQIESETTFQDTTIIQSDATLQKKQRSKETKGKIDKTDGGIFAPAVLLTKDVIGTEKLNKLRAKIISLHSDVIGKFTDTAQTEFGNQVLKVLFKLADEDGNGFIDERELTVALSSLGFDFLKEKQIAGIFTRADGDKNGMLDFNEFEKAAPKTLKTSLIKLAKKNGHDLGFLA